MSPFSIVGMKPSSRCRSEPQMAVEVIRTIASRGSSDLGVGDGVDADVALAVPAECFHDGKTSCFSPSLPPGHGRVECLYSPVIVVQNVVSGGRGFDPHRRMR